MDFKLNEYHRNVSDEELIEDVRRIAKRLGKDSLTIADYKANGGKYNHTTVSRRFGSWVALLQKCNLAPHCSQIKVISKEEMISDLQLVANKVNKTRLNSSEYALHGKYSKGLFFRKFGSWNNALIAAGLTPYEVTSGKRVSEYDAVEEIERIWTLLGHQPTTTDIKNGVSKYSLHVFERRFGTWRKALEFFVSYINGEQEVQKSDEIKNDMQYTDDTQERITNSEPKHKTKRDINLRMRFLVMKRDNFKCCMCGRSPATTTGLELHIDHIIPWSKGGETVLENLQTLCQDCNLGKSNIE